VAELVVGLVIVSNGFTFVHRRGDDRLRLSEHSRQSCPWPV